MRVKGRKRERETHRQTDRQRQSQRETEAEEAAGCREQDCYLSLHSPLNSALTTKQSELVSNWTLTSRQLHDVTLGQRIVLAQWFFVLLFVVVVFH